MTRSSRSATDHGARRLSNTERRSQILEVTGDLIEREGLGAVTMEGVALHAGVSKPVVYSHFANRSELLLALLGQLWDRFDELLSARTKAVTAFDEKLVAFVHGLFDVIEEEGPRFQVLWSQDTHELAVEEARQLHHRAYEERWAMLYEEHLGLSQPVARAAAATIRGAVEGAAMHWLRTSGVDRETCSETCLLILRASFDALRPGDAERP